MLITGSVGHRLTLRILRIISLTPEPFYKALMIKFKKCFSKKNGNYTSGIGIASLK